MNEDDASATRSGAEHRGLPDALVDLRCSVALIEDEAILLIRRVRPRQGGSYEDWILPGGCPRLGESMLACARRQTLEATGVDTAVGRCLFVLEVGEPGGGRRVDLVFAARGISRALPTRTDPSRRPEMVPLSRLPHLALRPPIAGYLRGLRLSPSLGAAHLGNLWRPDALAEPALSTEPANGGCVELTAEPHCGWR